MTRAWARRVGLGAFVGLLVCCVQAAAAGAAQPSAATAGSASAEAASPETVVVTLRGRADLTGLTGTTRRARQQAVVDRLRTTADTRQASLVAQLRTWRSEGTAAAFTRYWVANSIRVTALPSVVRQIAQRPDVVSVVADQIRLVPTALPATVNQQAIHAPEVWSAGHTGEGIVVASLDSGVDVTHVDLASRWRGGSNSWYDPYGEHPTTPTDLTGHGTGVTGVMVAGDSSGASIGSAPGASWIAARVFDDGGSSSLSAVHSAFQWLLDPDGDPSTADAPQVVNASWSIGAGPGCDLTLQPDVRALRAAGIVTVFAAGNFGPTNGSSVSPANYPESLSVGAVTDSATIAPDSSRGPSTCGGRTRPFPDLVAPGVDVPTTDRYGFFQQLSGTSVAAPHAAGALALLLSAVPALTADEQQDLLAATATDLGDPGPDETYGSGLVDAAAAYAALPGPQPSFDLAVTPGSATVEAGATTAFQVAVTPAKGFADNVTLAVTGLPEAGGTAAFTPPVVAGGLGTATLDVHTHPAASAGTFTLTVSASSGTLTRQTDLTLEVTAPQAPTDGLFFSTVGKSRPPGVSGTPDDADIYHWSGGAYQRSFDATLAGLPGAAAVDGFDRVDDAHFYLSFGLDSTTVPGLGTVQDEDVVYYDNGTWRLWFDGTAHGLTGSAADVDAISVVGSTLYFSTRGNVRPFGVGGIADDADIYRWNGSSFARTWDATAHGLPKSTNVDGVVAGDGSRYYLSFAPETTTVSGLGTVQDEDVVVHGPDGWSTYFDGTAHGLGAAAGLDLDAFDLP